MIRVLRKSVALASVVLLLGIPAASAANTGDFVAPTTASDTASLDLRMDAVESWIEANDVDVQEPTPTPTPTPVEPTPTPTPPPSPTANTSVSLWPSSDVPVNANYVDSQDIVLGQQFKVNKAGLITGVRFYKGDSNTGTHVGALYRDGTKIAQITLTEETARGWQTASFPTPVRAIVGATYTVAYTAPNAFNRDTGYFNGRTITSPDGSLTTVGAGLYAYNSAITNPTTSNGLNTNYWVDVSFTADVVAAPPNEPTTPVASLECPTNGSGGALTDRFNQNHTDAAGVTSQYHIWAAGIDPSKPVGVVIQLHGDGAGEFPGYGSSTGKLGRMSDYADDKNMILVSVKTPDRSTSPITWWRKPSMTVPYLNDFIDKEVFGKYNIEKDRVWLTGFSGGTEVQTLYYLKTLLPKICGGGTLLSGGGSSIDSSYTGQASDETKSDFRMHFYTGQDDGEGSPINWNGYNAAVNGANYWESKGFPVTRNFPAGVNHYELDEPAELDRLLDLYVPAP